MFHPLLSHGNAPVRRPAEQYSAGRHKAKSPLVLGALMPFAELRAFNRRNAKLFAFRNPSPSRSSGLLSRKNATLVAFLNPVFAALLCKYFIARITINKKAPVFRLGLFYLIGSLAVYYSRMAYATLPSSQLRFTSEFGMDSGGSTALLPPGKNCLASLT